ncbi:MAG: hypothetical protein M0T73_00795 [Deltaproteobacteria bacterium]|nr:hypothetical protein [Deltaproteobacteria bacterium]
MNCFILCFWLMGSLENQALAESSSEPAKTVVVTVFTSSECPYCENVKELLDDLKTQIPIKTEIFDINKPNDYDLYLKIEATHKNARFAVPLVIVGDKILIGQSEIFAKLEAIVKAFQASQQKNSLFGMAEDSGSSKKVQKKNHHKVAGGSKKEDETPVPSQHETGSQRIKIINDDHD